MAMVLESRALTSFIKPNQTTEFENIPNRNS